MLMGTYRAKTQISRRQFQSRDFKLLAESGTNIATTQLTVLVFHLRLTTTRLITGMFDAKAITMDRTALDSGIAAASMATQRIELTPLAAEIHQHDLDPHRLHVRGKHHSHPHRLQRVIGQFKLHH